MEEVMNYRVGQILFLISQSNNVIPVQVIEEISKTSLAGKELTYNIVFPNEERTISDVKKVKGKLFTSRDDVKKYMFDNTKNAINQLIANADKLCKEVFHIEVETSKKDNINDDIESAIEQIETGNIQSEDINTVVKNMQQNNNNDKIIVDIGNGVKARMAVSEYEKLGV
tara:strand:+ start:15265 stop:15774 length:510 start_codon:yes stop_codon:yes gene_type:complete